MRYSFYTGLNILGQFKTKQNSKETTFLGNMSWMGFPTNFHESLIYIEFLTVPSVGEPH